jgi:hypothetical protein
MAFALGLRAFPVPPDSAVTLTNGFKKLSRTKQRKGKDQRVGKSHHKERSKSVDQKA